MSLRDDLCRTREAVIAFARETFMLDGTELICSLMIDKKVTNSQLKTRLRVDKQTIERLLDGEESFEMVVRALIVLGHQPLWCSRELCDNDKHVLKIR